MSFRTAQLDGAVTLPWSAHLREVTLRFYGDVNCNYAASAVDALLERRRDDQAAPAILRTLAVLAPGDD